MWNINCIQTEEKEIKQPLYNAHIKEEILLSEHGLGDDNNSEEEKVKTKSKKTSSSSSSCNC